MSSVHKRISTFQGRQERLWSWTTTGLTWTKSYKWVFKILRIFQGKTEKWSFILRHSSKNSSLFRILSSAAVKSFKIKKNRPNVYQKKKKTKKSSTNSDIVPKYIKTNEFITPLILPNKITRNHESFVISLSNLQQKDTKKSWLNEKKIIPTFIV